MWRLALKVAGGFAVIAFLIWLYNYIVYTPEKWNDVAEGYHNQVADLTKAVARWQVVVAKKDSIIAKKDSVIANRDTVIRTQKTEWQKAIAYGTQWQTKFMRGVAIKDSLTDRLTDRERELEYYARLLNNGTLSPVNLGPVIELKPSNPKVITAGLKTADREASSAEALKEQTLAMGLLTARTERMRTGLVDAGKGFGALSQQAREAMKGGIPIIRHRRRMQLRAVADSADRSKAKADKASELEEELNQ
ncbi:hypothetical protein [Spirosoma flavum]|uniref:Uncharacterized protein n=1 Tax=Spirosoma flavum TaxID=2048557 RepID=A0ABW6ANW4_9BACT